MLVWVKERLINEVRFAPVSIWKLARAPFTKTNAFTLSSSEFTGEAADKDGCCLSA